MCIILFFFFFAVLVALIDFFFSHFQSTHCSKFAFYIVLKKREKGKNTHTIFIFVRDTASECGT